MVLTIDSVLGSRVVGRDSLSSRTLNANYCNHVMNGVGDSNVREVLSAGLGEYVLTIDPTLLTEDLLAKWEGCLKKSLKLYNDIYVMQDAR